MVEKNFYYYFYFLKEKNLLNDYLCFFAGARMVGANLIWRTYKQTDRQFSNDNYITDFLIEIVSTSVDTSRRV